VEISALPNLLEPLTVVSGDPTTPVPPLQDGWVGQGRRRQMGEPYGDANPGSPHLLPSWPCNSACIRLHLNGLAAATGTQIFACLIMSSSLTCPCEALLDAASGLCLTPCISSTVSTELLALTSLVQDWGFGSSACAVWRELSSCFSSDHSLFVFLERERGSPSQVWAVAC